MAVSRERARSAWGKRATSERAGPELDEMQGTKTDAGVLFEVRYGIPGGQRLVHEVRRYTLVMDQTLHVGLQAEASVLRQVEGEEPINASLDDNDNPRYQTDSFRMLFMKVRNTPLCDGEIIPSVCKPALVLDTRECMSLFPTCHRHLDYKRWAVKWVMAWLAIQVLPCCKRFVHDWSDCPFSHPGEKARRRDPKVHQYTGIACPDMKKVSRRSTTRIRLDSFSVDRKSGLLSRVAGASHRTSGTHVGATITVGLLYAATFLLLFCSHGAAHRDRRFMARGLWFYTRYLSII